MAWTAPSTFVAGAILTAASLNTNVRDNSLAGGPIYATEALRDAAITSPFEGQRAYITGSTVTTAAGGTTFIPSGVQTIYNGAAWVTVTPVSSTTQNTGTLVSTPAFTATLSGSPGTNASVTLATGTTALVSVSATLNTSSAGNGAVMAIAVSGATTIAGSADNGIENANGSFLTLCRTFVVGSLTAGTNTFTLQYSIPAAVTGTFLRRNITVQGIA